MEERTYQTRCGTIHYWASVSNPDTITLVFLPGLTADHRLFDKQLQYFESRYNVIVWDAPTHGSSWPFRFDFDLFDKAKWLNDILNQEGITRPVIIGQSMGGYVGQAYAQMCGTQDHAGSCIRYNKAWHRNTKIPLTWIEGAGHNSNTDKPEQINSLLEEFVANIL